MKKSILLITLIFCLVFPGVTWGEAPYINNRELTLLLHAEDDVSGVIEMRFSLNGEDWSDPEPYAEEKQIEVSEEEGNKEIWVQFKNRAKLWSPPIKVDIILDETPPINTSINCLW